jgi:RNA polymerase sigma-70 factor (ECF subfamily)
VIGGERQADARDALARVTVEDRGRLTAILAVRTGDLDLAEDCVHTAFERALEHWGRSGPPTNPPAWLLRVAHRVAIDRFRHQARFRDREREIADLSRHESRIDELPSIPDERLRLIFTCCHPALDPKSRVALTLRTLGGLTTEEIARAFLDKPATMGQRLSRAKAKIRDARIPFDVPDGPDRHARVASVLDVIYLIFNEGYAATEGATQVRAPLCEEAIFLARMMRELCGDDPEVTGLLALLLLTHARHDARADRGDYVPLSEQDRTRWDRARIAEGAALVETALGRGRVGPFQVKAAIAALHSEAADPASTDWPQILALYRLLARMTDTPVVRLNLAVALAEVEGPDAALAAIAPLAADLGDYQPYHAVRAELLRRQGDVGAARAAYDDALARTLVDSEAAFLRRRRDRLPT